MPLTVPKLADAMQTLLTTVADQAARDAGFIKRQRILTGASFVQTLVFSFLAKPDATYENLAQNHIAVAEPISPQGLEQRFTAAAAEAVRLVLHRAARHVLAAQPAALPVLQRFTGVEIQDSTTLTLPAALAAVWPGCHGSTPDSGLAALKVQLRWELLRGHLSGLSLEAGRASDAKTPLRDDTLAPGSLHLADLGFFSLARLQEQDRRGVYFLTRLKHGTAVYAGGQPIRDLALWLKGQQSRRVEVSVRIGSGQRLACRLVAVRVPKEVAGRRRRRSRKEARDKGYRLQPERLALCAWSVWVTNAPAAQLSAREVEVVSRVRWQIELLIKLWKGHGGLDESASAKPWRVLCEVYAKLLAMVIQHWILLVGWRQSGDLSLRKAAQTVRQHALHLASALGVKRRLCVALRQVERCLRHGLKINKRKGKPATFQLLAEAAQASPGHAQAA
jgi:hypothetical protein